MVICTDTKGLLLPLPKNIKVASIAHCQSTSISNSQSKAVLYSETAVTRDLLEHGTNKESFSGTKAQLCVYI
jgi:hypothetical protein